MPSARHPAKMQDFTESKHLKRSANGTPNKSVTKKNGAGGRGTWGRLDDYTIGAAYIDKKVAAPMSLEHASHAPWRLVPGLPLSMFPRSHSTQTADRPHTPLLPAGPQLRPG